MTSPFANKDFGAEVYAEAYARLGSYRAVARELGVVESTVRKCIQRLKRREATDPAVLNAMAGAGMEDIGALHSGWIKTKDASLYFTMPRGGDDASSIADQLREALADVPSAAPTPTPDVSDADLLAVYPLADAHIGMQAWGAETGEDYDTRIASERICSWMRRVVEASPPAETAIILDVGDLTHANDQTNMTPASKHIVDVDTRHFKTLDVTIWTLVQAVETALAKHRRVIVCILPGNHNRDAYLAVMFALAAHYRNEPRVEVQKKPGEFFIMEWGQCLVAAHHGDKAKAERLVLYMADRWPEMWGRTKWRFLFTGHLHHHKSADIGGVTWEQLRALTAKDAYAVSHAYAARAQLQGIVYHKTQGVRFRTYVNA